MRRQAGGGTAARPGQRRQPYPSPARLVPHSTGRAPSPAPGRCGPRGRLPAHSSPAPPPPPPPPWPLLPRGQRPPAPRRRPPGARAAGSRAAAPRAAAASNTRAPPPAPAPSPAGRRPSQRRGIGGKRQGACTRQQPEGAGSTRQALGHATPASPSHLGLWQQGEHVGPQRLCQRGGPRPPRPAPEVAPLRRQRAPQRRAVALEPAAGRGRRGLRGQDRRRQGAERRRPRSGGQRCRPRQWSLKQFLQGRSALPPLTCRGLSTASAHRALCGGWAVQGCGVPAGRRQARGWQPQTQRAAASALPACRAPTTPPAGSLQVAVETPWGGELYGNAISLHHCAAVNVCVLRHVLCSECAHTVTKEDTFFF